MPAVKPVAGKLNPANMSPKARVLASLLTISAAAFGTWQASEGFTETAVIPTKGDVPTIGHGSTRYEDGTKVKMGDRITRSDRDWETYWRD